MPERREPVCCITTLEFGRLSKNRNGPRLSSFRFPGLIINDNNVGIQNEFLFFKQVRAYCNVYTTWYLNGRKCHNFAGDIRSFSSNNPYFTKTKIWSSYFIAQEQKLIIFVFWKGIKFNCNMYIYNTHYEIASYGILIQWRQKVLRGPWQIKHLGPILFKYT